MHVKFRCINKVYFLYYIYVPIFILFVSFPILESTITYGSDLFFHLLRIESIKQGLLDGQFPVKLYPLRYNGIGDATGFFYPDFFLYIPALLRILGFSITNSLNIFILLINILTFFTSYWSFYKILKLKEIACISSLLYLSSLFRLVYLYSNAAVGTYLALAFMPMVFVSFYLIFIQHRKENYIFFIISISGVMQSHIISLAFCVIGCAAIFIYILLTGRANTNSICMLLRSIFIVILINAWFYFPFFELYKTINFNIKYPAFSDRNFIRGGYNFVMSIQFFCGFPILFLVFAGIGNLLGTSKKSLYIRYIKNIFIVNLLIAIVVFICCTNIIPYKEIINYKIIGRFISSIQYVARFQNLSMTSIAIISGISLYIIFFNIRCKRIYILLFLSFTLLFNYKLLDNGYINWFYDGKKAALSINHQKVDDDVIIEQMNQFDKLYAAADYIYSDFRPMANCIFFLDKLSGDRLDKLYTFTRKGMSLHFNTNYEMDVVASLPILYYPGFNITLTKQSGEKQQIQPESGIFHHIKIEIPAGNNEIDVKFVGLLRWKIAEFISLISFVFFVLHDCFGITIFNRNNLWKYITFFSFQTSAEPTNGAASTAIPTKEAPMPGKSPLNTRSDKLKNAITYVSEIMQADPTKDRNKVIDQAVTRFDLSPLDSELFYKHFSEK